MTSTFKHIMHVSVLAFTLAVTGCGKTGGNQFVKAVSVSTKDVDGDDWVNLTTTVEIGGAQVPSLTLPIVDPRNPSEVYGRIGLRPIMGSTQSNIELSVNLSKATGLPNAPFATLPNGNNLPVSVPAGIDVIELDIAQIRSKIYLALGPQTIMLGFAIAIKEFDVVARYIPGANIFLGFNIGPVRGNAGFFTSTQSGQSGLALFADVGSVLAPAPSTMSLSKNAATESLRFQQSNVSNAQLQGLKKSMTYLNGRQLKLH